MLCDQEKTENIGSFLAPYEEILGPHEKSHEKRPKNSRRQHRFDAVKRASNRNKLPKSVRRAPTLPPVSLELSICLGGATDRFRYPLLIISGDHCVGPRIFDCPANRFVHNRYVGTNSNPVEYLDHVR
jgi:hypothetical protein